MLEFPEYFTSQFKSLNFFNEIFHFFKTEQQQKGNSLKWNNLLDILRTLCPEPDAHTVIWGFLFQEARTLADPFPHSVH